MTLTRTQKPLAKLKRQAHACCPRCTQLADETLRLNAAYATAASQQTKARSNDVVGVILIGLPVSSLSGDNIAPEIARLKGEQEAVRKAMISKGCAEQPVPVPASKKTG